MTRQGVLTALFGGFILFIILGTALPAAAQTAAPPPSLPSIIDVGFNDFRAYGYSKAFNTWSYRGPLALNTRWQKRLADAAPFWRSLGRLLSCDNIQVQAISAHSTEVLLTAQFDRGEVFFRFIVYTVTGQQTVTAIEWATDPAQLLSED